MSHHSCYRCNHSWTLNKEKDFAGCPECGWASTPKPDTTGEPAFPSVETAEGCSVTPGMTLRDYFAAKAMQSMMEHYSRNDGILSRDYKEISEESFLMSDAMLAARKRKEDG